MGLTRKVRIIIWPLASAVAIIGLLVYHQRGAIESLKRNFRFASTRQLARPWTLTDQEQASSRARVAWTGPALGIEPFRRDELTYPFPPLCEIASSPLEKPSRKTLDYNSYIVVTDRDTDPGSRPGNLDPLGLPLGPSVMVYGQQEPLATLHAPNVNEAEELAGLPDPSMTDDPFEGMQLSSQKLNVVESSTSAVAALPDVQPAREMRLPKALPKQVPSEWPRTPTLHSTLDAAAELGEPVTQWCDAVRTEISQLQKLPRLASPEVKPILQRLQGLVDQAYEMIDDSHSLTWQRTVLATVYAIERRIQVWDSVWSNLTSHEELQFAKKTSSSVLDFGSVLQTINREIGATGDAEGWRAFLLIDGFEDVASGQLDEDQRRLLAQRFLSRVRYTEMNDVQSQWFDDSSCHVLAEFVRPWVHGPVDYVRLLSEIELQETELVSRTASKVAGTMQTLRFGESQGGVHIAETINKHYRNANIRLSISEEMLRRLLPAVPEKREPIRDRILGAQVRGVSYANTNLDVTLLPDPKAWKIQLGSKGTVDSKTWSRQGPASLHHVGDANFDAGTLIRVDRSGIELSDPNIQVESNTRLRRMRTDFDGFPVLGPLVREYVLSRHRDSRFAAKRQSEYRLRQKIQTQLTAAVKEQMDTAEKEFSARVVGPLSRLNLTPTVVDLKTSEERMTVRYRISGDWQLAAFTPRPRAPTSSLMSVQLHQSALNNALEQILPKTHEVSIEQLVQENLSAFGLEPSPDAETLPNDTMIRFTQSRPITIQVQDDHVSLTLRIVRLRKIDGAAFRNFIVRANYVPQIDGVRPMLVREDHLSISGPRLSLGDRLAIRTIFNKVLSPTRPLDLTSEELRNHESLDGLAITQFELRDGWIGFAIGKEKDYLAEADLYSAPILR